MHPYEALRRPLITEKSASLQAQGKYIFEVDTKANKHQVKQAVEKAFKVKVTSVNMIQVRGKTRRLGQRELPSPSWKKAIVTLKPGDKLEIFENV